MPTGTSISPAARIRGFTYAIRNIVGRGEEGRGRRPEGAVPEHRRPDPVRVQDAAAPGRGRGQGDARRPQRLHRRRPASQPAREAVAAEYESRGMPVGADRVVLTSGTSEGIELALGALADAGDEVLVPTPTYPLYTAVLAKIGARAVYYRTDPAHGWLPDLDDIKRLIEPGDARARPDRSQQPDRRGAIRKSTRRALIELADRAGVPILADEVYGDLGIRRPGAAARLARSRRADHFVLVAVEGVPRAGLARRLARRRPLRSTGRRAGGDQEAGRRPALQPGPDAVRASTRRSRATDRISRSSCASLRARADLTMARLRRDAGHAGASRRSAAFYAMPQVDAAAGQDRRGLRARPAARHRHPVRVRLRLRAARRPRASSAIVFLASPDELGDDLRRSGGVHRARFLARHDSADEQQPRHRPVGRRRSSPASSCSGAVPAARGPADAVRQRPPRDRLQPDRAADRARPLLAAAACRLPRWAAILVLYIDVPGAVALVLALVVPPLVGQMQQLCASTCRRMSTALQARRWSKRGPARITPGRGAAAVADLQTPAGWRSSGLVRRAAGLRRRRRRRSSRFCSCRSTCCSKPTSLQRRLSEPRSAPTTGRGPRASRARVTEKVGAWLGGQLLLARMIGSTATLGLLADRRAVLLRARRSSRRRRDDPGRRPDPGGGAGDPRWRHGLAADGALHRRSICWAAAVRREQLPGAAHHGAPGRREPGHDHGGAAHRHHAARASSARCSRCRRPRSCKSCSRNIIEAQRRRLNGSTRGLYFDHASGSAFILDTELDTLRSQGLHRSLRILEDRQAGDDARSTASRSSTCRRTTTSA